VWEVVQLDECDAHIASIQTVKAEGRSVARDDETETKCQQNSRQYISACSNALSSPEPLVPCATVPHLQALKGRHLQQAVVLMHQVDLQGREQA
jgi:hypothetical protein